MNNHQKFQRWVDQVTDIISHNTGTSTSLVNLYELLDKRMDALEKQNWLLITISITAAAIAAIALVGAS